MHGYDNNALAVGQAVLRETGAQDVILFGSRARGDYREDSDIDLLLVHQISASGHRYQRIHDLEELERDMRRAAPGFTYMLQSPLRLLSGYAGGEIYRRRPEPSLGNHTELRRQVETDVQQIFQRVAILTGKDPWLEQSDTPEA